MAPRGTVYAVDIQPEMLDLLRGYVAAEGVSGVVAVLGTETDPRLPPGGLDWILMVDVYHEFQKPEAMLEAIRRSLKPTGKVALIEYRLEGRDRRAHPHRAPHVRRLRCWPSGCPPASGW